MRVVIKTHVLRLVECRFDSVITLRGVLRIPVSHSGTRRDVQIVAIFRELRAIERQTVGRFFSVDLSGPAGNRNPATGNTDRSFLILTSLREMRARERYDDEQSEG